MVKYGVVVGILSVVICGFSYGDGCHFPVRAVKALPAIPSQRAVVIYRDGIETLIIESALEGEGEEFGWVIPLPTRPDEFEVVSSGFIETLSLSIQPNIIHDHLFIVPVIILACVTFVWFLTVKSNRDNISRAHSFIQFLLLLLLVVMIFSVFMPTLGRGGSRAIIGVEVVDSEEVGSYGLTVLEAEDAGAVNEWLGENGFVGLNESGMAIVEGYIADGWCFVAAKLKRDGDGYCVPHPLSMKFASEKAVYPMRLTAMAESDVYLELFVIAESGFEANGLELEFCDTYKFKTKAKGDFYNDKDLSGFVCSRWGAIGHPEAFDHMWDGCVMSRLAGVVGEDEMEEDIILEKTKSESYRKRYYSFRGAWLSGIVYGLVLWCALMIILTIKNLKKIQGIWGWKFAFNYVFLRSCIAGAILAVVIFVSVEKVRVGGVNYRPGIARSLMRGQMINTSLAIQYHFDQAGEASVAEVKELLERDLPEFELENYLSGEKIKSEDSPGNFTVFEDERGVVVRGYLVGGFPVDMVISEVFAK